MIPCHKEQQGKAKTFCLLCAFLSLSLALPISAQESFSGFIHGIRANAVKGEVLYQRDNAKFDLEAGLPLQEGDVIRTSRDAYAELLLQPGNFLRIGSETECRIFSDQHDKIRFQLDHGTISLEVLSKEEATLSLFPAKLAYDLVRVITPDAQVFIDQPGIFRINATHGQTELIVRNGEAAINGQRVKQKRSAVAAKDGIVINEIDSKIEDSFDLWSRERAAASVNANRSLKKRSPWSDKHKPGEQKLIDFHDNGEDKKSFGVISAKPGAVNFFEAGVEVSRSTKEWEQLDDSWEFEAGDKLRTSRYSFVELTLLPDTYLRLDSDSELSIDQLSNDLISLKLVRGSAILDVARFESKEPLPITISGPSTSVAIPGEGNYRMDVTRNEDRITVREGKVIFNKSPVSACRIIAGGTVSECAKQKPDTFDCWSAHRGEGKFFIGRLTFTNASALAGLRRSHFKKTGFWFQSPGETDYIFVPFTSESFRSPYGGNYSTVLAPEHIPVNRVDLEDHPLYRLPRLSGPRPPRP